jgi:hypothetical protein
MRPSYASVIGPPLTASKARLSPRFWIALTPARARTSRRARRDITARDNRGVSDRRERQKHRRDSAARRGQDFEAAVMEVRVPEPAHVRDFITTDLARLPSHRPRWVVGRSRGALPLAQQPLRQHVAPHRRVRRQRYQRRVGVDEDAQIVDVQLVAPAAVRLVLRAQRVARTARPWWLLLGILPHPRSQAAHRIDGGLACGSTSARGSSGRRSRTGRCHTRPASVVECHLELALLGDPRARR